MKANFEGEKNKRGELPTAKLQLQKIAKNERDKLQKRRKSAYAHHAQRYPRDTGFENLCLPSEWRKYQKIDAATSCVTGDVAITIDHQDNRDDDTSILRGTDGSVESGRTISIVETSYDSDKNEESDISSDFNDSNESSDDDRISLIYEEETEDNCNNQFNKQNVFTFGKGKISSEPLQIRANATSLDIIVCTIAAAIRAKMTYTCLEIIFKMMNWLFVDCALPRTKKSLWSLLSRKDDAGTKRHLYCRTCKQFFEKKDETRENSECRVCGSNDAPSYFIEIKITPQLQEIFSDPENVKSLGYRFTRNKQTVEGIEDIFDGKKYKEMSKPGGFLSYEQNYSFTLNTDGCSVCKSSKASAWPVMLEINEFPPNLRKRHMILAGIWVDTMHPNMNVLLLPTINELRNLYTNGITWTNPINSIEITSKFVTLLCVVDSAARPAVLNMTLHNGEYGCTFCTAKGTHMPGRGVQRRYPYSNTIHCRSDTDVRKHMEEAFETRTKKYGVKGPSALLLLPEFDLPIGTDVDSMHSVYLGVAKLHTSLLLSGKATNRWYAGTPAIKAAIDKRLLKIRPPSVISRKPKSIGEMVDWKASQWRDWTLYYAIPCLAGLIPQRHLNHFALLSRAMHTLNGDCISAEELDEARVFLRRYVKTFQGIFGIKNMKFNVHLLSHLADSVENWGPLWAHNAFPFESWNKKIIDKVTSANSRPLQIATRYLMIRFVESLLRDSTVPIETKQKIKSILTHACKNQRIVNLTQVPQCTFKGIGNIEKRSPCVWERQCLGTCGFRAEVLNFYDRAAIQGNVYKSTTNTRETRYCDTFVYCRNIDEFAEIDKIVSFTHNDSIVEGLLVKTMLNKGNAFGVRHIRELEAPSKRVFISIDNDVLVPAIIINTSSGRYGTKLSNIWEND